MSNAAPKLKIYRLAPNVAGQNFMVHSPLSKAVPQVIPRKTVNHLNLQNALEAASSQKSNFVFVPRNSNQLQSKNRMSISGVKVERKKREQRTAATPQWY